MTDAPMQEGPESAPGSGAQVPPVPFIRSHEKDSVGPYPVREGLSPTIGWLFRSAARGGPVFAVITRGGFLRSYSVHEAFPLTADGWAQAWQTLAGMSPENAARVQETLRERAAQDWGLGFEPGEAAELAALDAGTKAALRRVTLLGGYADGADMLVGRHYDIRFLPGRLGVYPHGLPGALVNLAYGDVEAVEIGGRAW
jgi:hypothetical protein